MNEITKKISSKMSFLAGAGSVLIFFFVIGFFVLLGVVIKDGKDQANVAADPSGYVAGAPTGSQPPSAPPEIQLAEITDADWTRGNRDAKVSIVEFSDLECPFCKMFHPTMQQVMKEYDGQVNWVYRHFPLSSLHKKAVKEAEATECAGELGGNEGFWAYVDRLFEITPSNDGLPDSQLPQIAEDVGLDRQKFSACLDSGKYAQKVQSHSSQAVAAGGQGTPYSVIVTKDGEKIPVSGAVPYEQIKSLLDQIL